MKRLISILVLAFLTLVPTKVLSYSSDPKTFISEVVDEALKVLSDKSMTKSDKEDKIKTIALEAVDIKALGMYTLGDVRKTLDPKSMAKYQNVFQGYFLKSLTSRLTDYSSQKFEIIDSDQKSATYTIVNSKISASSNQPEIKIEWRVYTKDPLKPLIRDLIVEGLSLARTQKEEFASIMSSNNNDINALLKKLEEFVSN
tara:strand:- start:72 stop:671 length:600 start_codon:yes stop_codon:yes gene_type:complete